MSSSQRPTRVVIVYPSVSANRLSTIREPRLTLVSLLVEVVSKVFAMARTLVASLFGFIMDFPVLPQI